VAKRVILLAILGYFSLFMVLTLLLGFRWNKQRKAPDQPIAFSHEIHIGKLGLECLFCHDSADKSTFAGVPAVETCMSCHVAVMTDSPEVQKIHKYWEDEEPIPWNRVHRIRIRNHVYFSHERHVKAGVDCQQCHGELKAMEKVRAVSSLKMGWCVSCHQDNGAPTDCLICHK
jgi:hypothetical protein